MEEQNYSQCHHCLSDLTPRSTRAAVPHHQRGSPKIFAPNSAENLKGLQMPRKYIQTLQPVADFSHPANSPASFKTSPADLVGRCLLLLNTRDVSQKRRSEGRANARARWSLLSRIKVVLSIHYKPFLHRNLRVLVHALEFIRHLQAQPPGSLSKNTFLINLHL